MTIQVFVSLDDLISLVLFGIAVAILIIGWIVVGIVNGFDFLTRGHRERKRQKMYEEYERKYGEGSDTDEYRNE